MEIELRSAFKVDYRFELGWKRHVYERITEWEWKRRPNKIAGIRFPALYNSTRTEIKFIDDFPTQDEIEEPLKQLIKKRFQVEVEYDDSNADSRYKKAFRKVLKKIQVWDYD